MATAKQTAARLVLAGVPRIGYDVHLSPFPGALYSWLQFMGDPADYDYLMGVTGACFRRLWNRDDGGNVDLMYLAPEPYARALRALGYDVTIFEALHTRWAIPGGRCPTPTAPASWPPSARRWPPAGRCSSLASSARPRRGW